jgi:HD-GYP domain-containing protein (c-di-GMP phosphodiesterase class II)
VNGLDQRLRKLGGILEAAQALTSERDFDKLLGLIVQSAARVVDADRCTLFLVDRDRGELWSKVAQGVTIKEIRFPMNKGIAGAVATTGQLINIPDAYADERFNPAFDKQTGYRTKAILCAPMKSLDGEVVGLLQALNKTDGTPFTAEDEELILALGGQAAAAVNNALLHQEIEQLFEGFVRASVIAIEARDPTTAGHSDRVARFSIGLADVLPRAGASAGRWKGAQLTSAERQELRYASLLHDFGKVGVRENVLVKANKLEPFELEALRGRFETMLVQEELKAEREKVAALLQGGPGAREQVAAIDRQLAEQHLELHAMFEFICGCNKPSILPDGMFDRLGVIGSRTYKSPFGGSEKPLLSGDEIRKLSIRKGSLTEEERKEIESHVNHTYRFLSQIPWTRALKRVPDIAYGHHEKLTGRGYPRGLNDPDIPVQTRMMTISDIYDALTASDRPYKKAVPKQKAFDILKDEAKRGEVDSDLLAVFIEADVPSNASQD